MWIGRRADSTIYGTWTVPQKEDEFHPGLEEVPDDHADYLAFVNRRVGRIHIDPMAKIAELESRLAALERK